MSSNFFLFVRHGDAGKRSQTKLLDESRSLTKKGVKQIASLSASLKEWEVPLELIVTSPLARAKETAEILSASLRKPVEIFPLLKPEGNSNTVGQALLKEFKKINLCLVGHEPQLSHLISWFLTKREDSFIDLKKGGAALLEKNIEEGRIALQWCLSPQQIL